MSKAAENIREALSRSEPSPSAPLGGGGSAAENIRRALSGETVADERTGDRYELPVSVAAQNISKALKRGGRSAPEPVVRPSVFSGASEAAQRIRAAIAHEPAVGPGEVGRGLESPAVAVESMLRPLAEARSRGGVGMANFQPIVQRFEPSSPDLTPEETRAERSRHRQEQNRFFEQVLPRLFSNIRQVPSPAQMAGLKRELRPLVAGLTFGLSEAGGPGFTALETGARALFGGGPEAVRRSVGVLGQVIRNPARGSAILEELAGLPQRIGEASSQIERMGEDAFSPDFEGDVERATLGAQLVFENLPSTAPVWQASRLAYAAPLQVSEAVARIEAGETPRQVITQIWADLGAGSKAADFLAEMVLAPDNLLIPGHAASRVTSLADEVVARKVIASADDIAETAATIARTGRVAPEAGWVRWIADNVPGGKFIARSAETEAALWSDEAGDGLIGLVAHADDPQRLAQMESAFGTAGRQATEARLVDEVARLADEDPAVRAQARATLERAGFAGREVAEDDALRRFGARADELTSQTGQRTAILLNHLGSRAKAIMAPLSEYYRLADEAAHTGGREGVRLQAEAGEQLSKFFSRLEDAALSALGGPDPHSLGRNPVYKSWRGIQTYFARYAHFGYTFAYAVRNGLQNSVSMLLDGINPLYGNAAQVEARFGAQTAAGLRAVGSGGPGLNIKPRGALGRLLDAPALRLNNRIEREMGSSIVAQGIQRVFNRYWTLEQAIPERALYAEMGRAGLSNTQIRFLLSQVQGAWTQKGLTQAANSLFESAGSRFVWQFLDADTELTTEVRALGLEEVVRELLLGSPDKATAIRRMDDVQKNVIDAAYDKLLRADGVPLGSWSQKHVQQMRQALVSSGMPARQIDQTMRKVHSTALREGARIEYWNKEVLRMAGMIEATGDASAAAALREQAKGAWNYDLEVWAGPPELHGAMIAWRREFGLGTAEQWDAHYQFRARYLRELADGATADLERLGIPYRPLPPAQFDLESPLAGVLNEDLLVARSQLAGQFQQTSLQAIGTKDFPLLRELLDEAGFDYKNMTLEEWRTWETSLRSRADAARNVTVSETRRAEALGGARERAGLLRRGRRTRTAGKVQIDEIEKEMLGLMRQERDKALRELLLQAGLTDRALEGLSKNPSQRTRQLRQLAEELSSGRIRGKLGDLTSAVRQNLADRIPPRLREILAQFVGGEAASTLEGAKAAYYETLADDVRALTVALEAQETGDWQPLVAMLEEVYVQRQAVSGALPSLERRFNFLNDFFDEVADGVDLERLLEEQVPGLGEDAPFHADFPSGPPHPALSAFNLEMEKVSVLQYVKDAIRARGDELVGGLTVDQRDAVLGALDKHVRPNLDQVRTMARSVGQEMRDFALFNYKDRRNFDTALGIFFSYPYWPTRMYASWVRRAFEGNWGAIAALFKLDAGLRRINANLEAPWFQGQLNVGELYGQQLYIPIQQMLNPLYGVLGDKLRDPDKRFTPATTLVDELSQWGPSAHTGLYLLMSFLARRAGNEDAALAWSGYTTGQPGRAVNALSVLLRQAGWQAIPAGGVGLEPHLYEDGMYGGYFLGDKWERRRYGKQLRQMVLDGEVSASDAYLVGAFGPDVGERTGRQELQAVWEVMLDRSRQQRAVWNLLSWGIGAGVKGRPESDIEVAQMDAERRALIAMKGTMSDEEYALAWDELRAKYPFSDLVFFFRENADERDEMLFWSVYNRLPPRNRDLLDAAGVDGEVLDRVFEAKGDLTALSAQERADFVRGITTLAIMLEWPPDATTQEWNAARRSYRAMRGRIENELGAEIWPLVDAYYAERDRGAGQGTDFIERYPSLEQYFDLQNQLLQSDPLLLEYYTSMDTLERLLRHQFHIEMSRRYPDIDDLWTQYHLLKGQDPEAASDFFAEHPQLKAYLNARDASVLERDARLAAMVQQINALQPRRTPELARAPQDVYERRVASVVTSHALELKTPDLAQMDDEELAAAINQQISSARLGQWFNELERSPEHYDRSLTAFLEAADGYEVQGVGGRPDALALLAAMRAISEANGWQVPTTPDQILTQQNAPKGGGYVRARRSGGGGGGGGRRGGRAAGGGGGAAIDVEAVLTQFQNGDRRTWQLFQMWVMSEADQQARILAANPDFAQVIAAGRYGSYLSRLRSALLKRRRSRRVGPRSRFSNRAF